MSNRRKPGLHNAYRSEYLRSPAWHARRDRWFTRRALRGIPLTCLGCGRPALAAEVELHHVSYAGVIRRDDRWVAIERDCDLVPLHPYCHDLLHRLMDRDAVLAKRRNRVHATVSALARLRHALAGDDDV